MVRTVLETTIKRLAPAGRIKLNSGQSLSFINNPLILLVLWFLLEALNFQSVLPNNLTRTKTETVRTLVGSRFSESYTR